MDLTRNFTLSELIKSDTAVRRGINNNPNAEQIEKLKIDRNYYARNFIKPSVRKQMENTIANYKDLLKEQEKTILELTASRDSLYSENTTLKEEIVHINDTILELEKIQHDQEEELKIGRRLKVTGLKVFAIKKPGKGKKKYEQNQTYKKKDLVQTYLEFNIEPNPIALIEQKEIYVQVLDADKKVVFNMDKGSGKFTIEKESGSKEMTYTIKQNITYQRTDQKLTMTFENPTQYQTGEHTVRVWCEDAIIGTSTFKVK